MIRHLDDALTLISGRKDFVVKRDPDYIAIDYAVAFPDTFEEPLRCELRGLKFFPDTGEIMARPLHKFFNVGEKEHTREKNVLATILDGLADDLRPLLSPEDRAQLDAYERKLTATMLEEARSVQVVVDEGAHLDQKAFAVAHLEGYASAFRSMAFSVRAGKASALEVVRQSLRKHCSTQTDVDAVRERIGTTWDELAGVE